MLQTVFQESPLGPVLQVPTAGPSSLAELAWESVTSPTSSQWYHLPGEHLHSTPPH